MAAVPNALVVQIHRDPVEALNSFNSLIYTLHSGLMKPYWPAKMVETNLRAMDMFVEKNLAVRDALDLNICDVFYDDLVSDTVGTVQKIYAHLGLEWTDTFDEHISQYVANHPRGKYGMHQYRASDFDLTDAQIRERYREYIKRYTGWVILLMIAPHSEWWGARLDRVTQLLMSHGILTQHQFVGSVL